MTKILDHNGDPVEPDRKTAAELMGWAADLSDVGMRGGSPIGDNHMGHLSEGGARWWITPKAGENA